MQLISTDGGLGLEPNKETRTGSNIYTNPQEEVMRSFSKSERSGSLVSKDHDDLHRVTEKAVKTTKDAIKISFRDIDYKVQVADPNRATTGQRHKHLHVLKKCSGVLFPG